VQQRFPRPAFDIDRVPTYHPPMSRAVMVFGAIQFVLLLQGVAAFLWFADRMPLAQAGVWVGALCAGLWAVGAVLQGRITMTVALMIESAALATATAALGHIELHRVFKPLTMLIAIVFVVGQQAPMRPGGRFSFEKWLLAAALAASLAGDAFLMFPGFFIPGLVSFLVAHLLYIALFRRDAPWFASRGALAATLAVGGGMYAFLWQGGLPVALRISGGGLRGGDRADGGAGHRPRHGAARSGRTGRGDRRRVLHAQRLVAGGEPVCLTAADVAGLGAVDLLCGATSHRVSLAIACEIGSSRAIRPSISSISRSQRAASRGSCVTTRNVVPRSACMRRICTNTSSDDAVSRLPVGSSASTSGRLHDQRAGDGHALLHAARQLARPLVHGLGQAHGGQQLARLVARLRRDAAFGHQRRHGHVLQRGEGRQQVVELEHKAQQVAPRSVRPASSRACTSSPCRR
jgi:hypothetical protein